MILNKRNKNFAAIVTVLLAGLVALSPFAIDTYLVAMPSMASYFGVEINIIQLTITLYFLGFAIGNFFGGPLSDAFGRKTIALIGIGIYGLSAFLITISPSIEYVLVLRILQAFGGGFATVTANVMVRDWYEGRKVARIITIMSMIMMLAPLFAPLIGTLIIKYSTWTSIFVFLYLFAIALFAIIITLIPESRDKALITKRLTGTQLLDKYRSFFSDSLSVILMFSISCAMAGLYVFLSTSSFIFMDYFGVAESKFPLIFGGIISLNVVMALANTFLLKWYTPRQILHVGLIIQLVAAIGLATQAIAGIETLLSIIVNLMLFIGSLGLIFGNGSAAILNINPKVSGSANATLGITRFLVSFVIGSLISIFHTGSLKPAMIAMLSCSLFANGLYLWIRRK